MADDFLIIARCEKCGRGFYTPGEKTKTDPFHAEFSRPAPDGSWPICGGKIVRVDSALSASLSPDKETI